MDINQTQEPIPIKNVITPTPKKSSRVSHPPERYSLLYDIQELHVDEENIHVDDPLCGTNVEYDEYEHYPKDASMQPKVTVTEGSDKVALKEDEDSGKKYARWTNDEYEPFEGTILAGNMYLAEMEFELNFKYYVKKGVTQVLVNDKAVPYDTSGDSLDIDLKLTAIHDWGEIFRVDPTLVSEGYEARTCRNPECGEKEIIKTFPKITYYNSSGNGNVWTKGSTTTSDFTFKRTYEDSSFRFFTGIQVDGKEVAKTNYSASAGSTVIKLNPAYLETLSIGGHTITAMYTEPDIGSATASANFTVKAKASGGSSTPKKPSTPVDNVVTCQMAGYPSNYAWNEAAKACQAGYIDAGGNFHPYGATVRKVPNTADRDIMIHAWIAMLSITIGLFCAVKLLHEDWEV